ncbi:MltR family transcriptional regulator [Pseudomonas sp. MH9.3]|uniref:MltR family transcriptional regulator n=1 Tax=Pseudomonas sp. MH9.3 TaxID=3048630 RepID=UPI002AC93395|nr:MltR family transcriptional regulator [Pseudomonas sp. MH9.3]MEB0106336.1 transcriptional regulator [Pseudomonas sp. MH9.3]WPX78103.1 transcriptional regulator [Pseudomonas sp. MH9.3]WQG59273.1 transcriptional regulator [Pseudomonas sp. RTB3]
MDEDNEDDSSAVDDDVFGNLNALGPFLDELDDRGLVLSLASFAEEALGNLLKAFMLPGPTTIALVDGFNAPLGNFSSRIKAAFSFGLVSKKQFNDLEQLRAIRNSYAHTWKPIALTDQKISGHIRSMNYAPFLQAYPAIAEEKLRSSGYALLLNLIASANAINQEGRRVEEPKAEIMFGFAGEASEQIQNARDQLTEVYDRMRDTSGAELEFYREVLVRFHARTAFIGGALSPTDRQSLRLLEKEIEEKIASIPSPRKPRRKHGIRT